MASNLLHRLADPQKFLALSFQIFQRLLIPGLLHTALDGHLDIVDIEGL